jgi:3-oxoadipate enol-lactonase
MIQTATLHAPDGVAFGARHAGPSGPALVFVHGVGSTAAIWDAQLEAFSGQFRCFAIELRGNGVPKPEPDPSSITRQGFAQDVLALLEWAGVERFTLIGCSLGGVIAFELWPRAAARVDSLMIVGSFAKYPNGQTYADGVKEAVVTAGDMAAFARVRAPKLGLPPDREAETIAQMACKSVQSYLASTQATWTGDYTSMLSTIAVPVLVTCGERDAIAPLALSREIATAIPGAELETIPNAGHVANADNPAAFNTMLAAFLSKVRSR